MGISPFVALARLHVENEADPSVLVEIIRTVDYF